MEKLLDAVSALVFRVSPEKVQAIANRIRLTEISKVAIVLRELVGTPMAAGAVDQLLDAWRNSHTSCDEVASMLLAASYVSHKVAVNQSTELVWTGPTTPFVSARRTEQALLQVINAAEHTLFITSFVAYDVSTIVSALNVASNRGVMVSMLLERSIENGGSISFDVIAKMKNLVPSAQLYAWQNQLEPFLGGSVHAKVAVADQNICFITSANLTGFAMNRNMEAGLLISGGGIPKTLDEHLQALVAMRIVSVI